MTMRLQWRPREEPLACAAVAGTGPTRAPLCSGAADRLRAGARLRAVASDEWVVLLGDARDLPWADGAVYLGWEAGLLVPTALVPTIPSDLVRRTLDRPADEIVVVLPGAILSAPQPSGTADPTALVP